MAVRVSHLQAPLEPQNRRLITAQVLNAAGDQRPAEAFDACRDPIEIRDLQADLPVGDVGRRLIRRHGPSAGGFDVVQAFDTRSGGAAVGTDVDPCSR